MNMAQIPKFYDAGANALIDEAVAAVDIETVANPACTVNECLFVPYHILYKQCFPQS